MLGAVIVFTVLVFSICIYLVIVTAHVSTRITSQHHCVKGLVGIEQRQRSHVHALYYFIMVIIYVERLLRFIHQEHWACVV